MVLMEQVCRVVAAFSEQEAEDNSQQTSKTNNPIRYRFRWPSKAFYVQIEDSAWKEGDKWTCDGKQIWDTPMEAIMHHQFNHTGEIRDIEWIDTPPISP